MAPATCGVAAEVPKKLLSPYEAVETPSGEAKSGLMSPLLVGPLDEKYSKESSPQYVAPAVIAFGLSAGIVKLEAGV